MDHNQTSLNEQSIIKGQGWKLFTGISLFEELFIKKGYVATLRTTDDNGWQRIDFCKIS